MNDEQSGAGQALIEHAQQSLQETRLKLEHAVQRIVEGTPCIVEKGTKLNPSAVSKEADVDRSTLYRFHKPILAEIRRINGTNLDSKVKANRAQINKASSKLKEYRKLVEEAQSNVTALARINYRLQARIDELEEKILVRDQRITALQRQLNS